ncbi:MAG: hypothetical protein KAQ65_10425 [Candidatus Thorarchaeota archaeon]|nr:hypothetical protein [Candidatus Thorarchaeota archaeon]MCK5239684.1 hypothetical protein [Candidatus Thorarchaeota archaeon]
MVRLTTVSNLFAGIGIAVIAGSGGLWALLSSIELTPGVDAWNYPFYLWVAGAVILCLVIIMSAITTFTELTGFVHPEDKLVSNMFVFLQAITTILVIGILFPSDTVLQERLFNVAAMIVIAYVFLFVFIFFSAEITEGSEMGQVKEMTSRFMLVSLFLGAIMAGIKVFLDWVWDVTASYGVASLVLAIFAVVLVFGIVAYLGRKYEPVGE